MLFVCMRVCLSIFPLLIHLKKNIRMSCSLPLSFSDLSISTTTEWRTTLSSSSSSSSMLGGGRSHCAHAVLGNELFLIGGIHQETHQTLDTVVSYNWVTQQWTQHPSLPQPRTGCAAAAIDHHQFIVVGGCCCQHNQHQHHDANNHPCNHHSATTHTTTTTNSNSNNNNNISCSALLYDTDTHQQSPLPNLRIGRRDLACVALHNRVYVVGGHNVQNGTQEDTMEMLDLSSSSLSSSSNTWTLLPNRMKTPRAGCAATAIVHAHSHHHNSNNNNDMVIVVVGGANHQDGYLNSCETYHTQQRVWNYRNRVPPMMQQRAGHALVSMNHGKRLVALGGYNGSHCTPTVEMLHLHNDDYHEGGGSLPPQQQQWTSLPSMSTPRVGFAALATTTTTMSSSSNGKRRGNGHCRPQQQQGIVVVAGGWDGHHRLETTALLQLPHEPEMAMSSSLSLSLSPTTQSATPTTTTTTTSTHYRVNNGAMATARTTTSTTNNNSGARKGGHCGWELLLPPPKPPELERMPLGLMNEEHKRLILQWIEHTRGQRRSYELQMAKAMRESLSLSQPDLESMKRTAHEYFTMVDETLEATHEIIGYIDSTATLQQPQNTTNSHHYHNHNNNNNNNSNHHLYSNDHNDSSSNSSSYYCCNDNVVLPTGAMTQTCRDDRKREAEPFGFAAAVPMVFGKRARLLGPEWSANTTTMAGDHNAKSSSSFSMRLSSSSSSLTRPCQEYMDESEDARTLRK